MSILIFNANLPFGIHLTKALKFQQSAIYGTLFSMPSLMPLPQSAIKYISTPKVKKEAVMLFNKLEVDTLFFSMIDLDMENATRNLQTELKNYYSSLLFALDCASEINLKKFIVVMFKGIYKNDSIPLLSNNSVYNQNKKIALKYISAISKLRTLPLSVIFSPNIFGVHLNCGIVYNFINKLFHNEFPSINSFDEVELVNADRLAEYCVSLIGSNTSGNICVDGYKILPEQLLKLLSEKMQKDLKPHYNLSILRTENYTPSIIEHHTIMSDSFSNEVECLINELTSAKS